MRAIYKITHNDKNTIDKRETVTIAHPFHPENGKIYEFLGLVQLKTGDHVRCLDEEGKLRFFPVSITDMKAPADSERLGKGGCIVSVDDLISLMKLVAALSSAL